MIHARIAILVVGLILGFSGALAEDCSEEVIQDSFQVSFEKNRRTGQIKSLDTVEVTFDYGKVQSCFGGEEPRLYINNNENWAEVNGGRNRRNTWTWNLETVKPCQVNWFRLAVGDQNIDRVLESRTNDEIVDFNYRLGAPDDVWYVKENQVIEWTEVTCATGYHIEMFDMDNNLKEFEVTENRLGSELAELSPCQEMELYIYPYVIESANRNSRDEAYFSFEKFPDFSKGFLTISDVTSNSVDMKVQLDSLRCVESLSVAITEQDSDDTLDSQTLDQNSQETIRFANLNPETDYEIKIEPKSVPVEAKKVRIVCVLMFKCIVIFNFQFNLKLKVLLKFNNNEEQSTFLN